MVSKVVTVLSNSGTGTQDITFSADPAWTPKVAIIQWSYAARAAGFNEGVSLGYGFTDGTNSRSIAYVSEDATASSDTARVIHNTNLITALNQTGTITTIDAAASFTQWLSNGMQITWSNAPTAQFYIQVTFLGGDDLTNVEVGTLQITTGNSCSRTGMAWQPDFGMFLYGNTSTHNSGSSTVPSLSIGAAKDSSNQWNQTWYHADGSGSSAARVSYSHSRVVVQHTTSLTAYSSFGTWNSDGFTLNNTDMYALDHPLYYLVIKGGSIKVGNATEPAGTGDQTITTNTDVKSVMILGADISAEDTITASGMFSTGMGDGSNQASVTCDELPASDPMANAVYYSTSYIYNNITAAATATSSTVDDQASLASVSGTGFVLNWNNIGQARPYRYITFGTGVILTDVVKSVTAKYDIYQEVPKSVTTKYDVYQEVTKQVTAKHDIYQEIVKQTSVKFDVYEEVTKTLTTIFDILTNLVEVTKKVKVVFDINPTKANYIPLTGAGGGEAAAAGSYYIGIASYLFDVVKTLTAKFDIAQEVSKSVTTKHDIYEEVEKAVTAKFDILQEITKQITLLHDIYQEVSQYVTTEFDVYEEVTKSTSVKFDILQEVTKQIITLFDILVIGYVDVVKSTTVKFDILEEVQKSGTVKFDILEEVQKQVALQFNILQQITKQVSLISDIYQEVPKSTTIKFDILQQITKQVSVLHDIYQETIKQVTTKFDILEETEKTVAVKFDIIQEVTKQVMTLFDILVMGYVEVIKTTTTKFDIFEEVEKSTAVKFDIRQEIIKQVTLLHNIYEDVPKSITAKFDILQEVAKSTTVKFDVMQEVTKQLTALFDIYEMGFVEVTKSLTTIFNIAQEVPKSVSTKFDILEEVDKSTAIKFSILQEVAKNVSIKFDIIQEVMKTNSMIFDILEEVEKTGTTKFDIFETVEKDVTVLYDIVQEVTKEVSTIFDIYSMIPTVEVIKSLTTKFDIYENVEKSVAIKFAIIQEVVKQLRVLFDIWGKDHIDSDFAVQSNRQQDIFGPHDHTWNRTDHRSKIKWKKNKGWYIEKP